MRAFTPTPKAGARCVDAHAGICGGAARKGGPYRDTSQGSPYTIFRRALERRSLTGVRGGGRQPAGPAAARRRVGDLPAAARPEPDRYQRAAVRWLGRLLLEPRGVSLRHAELAAAYLTAWPDPARRDAASEALGELGRAVGLPRLGTRLASADGR
jgi:hypothetical protein